MGTGKLSASEKLAKTQALLDAKRKEIEENNDMLYKTMVYLCEVKDKGYPFSASLGAQNIMLRQGVIRLYGEDGILMKEQDILRVVGSRVHYQLTNKGRQFLEMLSKMFITGRIKKTA